MVRVCSRLKTVDFLMRTHMVEGNKVHTCVRAHVHACAHTHIHTHLLKIFIYLMCMYVCLSVCVPYVYMVHV